MTDNTSHARMESIGDKPRRGAPAGNRNALQSGVQAFVSGRWPKGAGYVAKIIGQLRTRLEAAVMSSRDCLEIHEEALIQSCCRHEARALLWQRWLRLKAETLTVDQMLSLTREIGNATDARDRCIKALGLKGKDPITFWQNLGSCNPLPSAPLDSGDDEEANR